MNSQALVEQPVSALAGPGRPVGEAGQQVLGLGDPRRAWTSDEPQSVGWPVRCGGCGAGYDVDDGGWPVTASANTCDDCGGYVNDADPWQLSTAPLFELPPAVLPKPDPEDGGGR